MAADNTFCLNDFDAIGFDLDHTIAKYKLNEVMSLTYDSLAKYLIEKKGYDKVLLEPMETDKDFLIRGLVFDIKLGNFLKLSEDGKILRASHGRKKMTDEEIEQDYGKDKKWHEFEELKETLKQTDNFRYFENSFDLPGSILCARIIDLIDKKENKRPEKYEFLPDVWAAFGNCYSRENFAANTGDFFPSVKKNPEKYYEKCSEGLKKWLRSLKESGKYVFLCTSSHVDYAKFLLEFILGSDWQSYFNLCITYARKPGFFRNTPAERPFFKLDNDIETKEVVTDLESNKIYSQGNAENLMGLLRKVTEKENPKVAYIGDSLRSDVHPVAQLENWYALLVLEEMEVESLNGKVDNDGDEPLAKKRYTVSNLMVSICVNNNPKGIPPEGHFL
uniref:5'-nucleotidase domain-containing protein 1-like n=1 Tax=Saccoglossus kowalevskii TaxID=10224 RepID=A0ABM0MZ88_SACKO|nr:PREDICTED: 5'-nucleotidase domain-containing protein 1-like [Saccoglossus kowalevskii]